MVLMEYATSKGPWSNCLLADMKQIDQTTKVIRHLTPLDDFFMGVLRPFQEYFIYIEPIVIKSERKPEFIKTERKPENPGKKHLTFRKQNLGFPHVTRARLEPQRWET